MNLYIFILFFSVSSSETLPEIYGSACIASGEQLHLVGGYSSSLQQRSNNIYSIDMKEITKGNSPEWQTHSFDLDKDLGPFFSAVSLSKNTAIITEASPNKPFFKLQEINFKSFSITQKRDIEADSTSQNILPNYLENGIAIAKNDMVADEYIIHHSAISDTNLDNQTITYSYNLFSNSLQEIKYGLYDMNTNNNFNSIATYKGIMYLIGNFNRYSLASRIYGLDLKSRDWSTYNVHGDVPDKQCKFSYTQVNNLLYTTGGENCSGDTDNSETQNFVYVLNLDNLTWKKYTVDDFTGFNLGCLVYYNELLLHVSGYLNDQPIQTIDTRTWKLFSNEEASSFLIQGLAIGFVLLLAAGLISYWYFRKKRHANKLTQNISSTPNSQSDLSSKYDTFIYPEYVTDNLWIPHYPNQPHYSILKDINSIHSNLDSGIFDLTSKPEFQGGLEEENNFSLAKVYTK